MRWRSSVAWLDTQLANAGRDEQTVLRAQVVRSFAGAAAQAEQAEGQGNDPAWTLSHVGPPRAGWWADTGCGVIGHPTMPQVPWKALWQCGSSGVGNSPLPCAAAVPAAGLGSR